MSLRDALAIYLAEAALGWRPTTLVTRRCSLGLATRWLEDKGHRRWSTVTAADIDAYALDLIAAGRRRGTVRNAISHLRVFTAWLAERGLILRDPGIGTPPIDHADDPLPPPPLSEAQIATLYAAIPRRHVIDLRDHLMLDLLYACGLRRSEVIHLDVSDLDLEQRTVLVRDSKAGGSRIVPALAGTLSAASAYLALRRELVRGPDRGVLILGHHGGRLRLNYVNRWLERLSRRVGFHVHPHLLRHSIAVHLLRRGTDLRYIQQFLGHGDLDTTKIYLRLTPGHLRDDYDDALPPLLGIPHQPQPTFPESDHEHHPPAPESRPAT